MTTFSKEWSAATDVTISPASVADGAGRLSTEVTHASPPQKLRIYYRITTGTSPTNLATILFYFLRTDEGTSPEIRDGGVGATDAALTAAQLTDIANAVPAMKVQPVTATSDKSYDGSFEIEDPGPAWSLAIANESGAALNSTGGNHTVRYRTINTVDDA